MKYMKILKLKTILLKMNLKDNFCDLETLDKRKLRNTKKKDIKFNIKRTSKTIDKQINKNVKIIVYLFNIKTKKKNNRKRK